MRSLYILAVLVGVLLGVFLSEGSKTPYVHKPIVDQKALESLESRIIELKIREAYWRGFSEGASNQRRKDVTEILEFLKSRDAACYDELSERVFFARASTE